MAIVCPIPSLPRPLQRRGELSTCIAVPPSFGGDGGGCEGLYLFLRHRHVCSVELFYKFVDAAGCLCHPVLEGIVGKALVTEQLRQFKAEINYLADNFPIVVCITFAAERVLGQIHLPAQFAVVSVCEERPVAWRMQGEKPTLLSFLLCCQSCSILCCIRKTGQVVGIGDVKLIVVGLLELVLAELQSKLPKLRFYGCKLLLVLFAE